MRLGRQQPVTTQLERLALAGSTGVLRLRGNNDGAVHLYQGYVTCAESSGTPDVTSRLARWTGLDGRAPNALERDWVIRESTADAALAMLTPVPRPARFTGVTVSSPDGIGTMTVQAMLAEVNRRREIIRQLPAWLTADTTVARNPRLSARGVHVSAGQWALLTRMNTPATPRGLAMECGRSVFATTLEIFRLIAVDLVNVIGGQQSDKQPHEPVDHRTIAISFIRAVPEEPQFR